MGGRAKTESKGKFKIESNLEPSKKTQAVKYFNGISSMFSVVACHFMNEKKGNRF